MIIEPGHRFELNMGYSILCPDVQLNKGAGLELRAEAALSLLSRCKSFCMYTSYLPDCFLKYFLLVSL